MLSLANKMCKNGVGIGQSGTIPASDTCRLNFMNQRTQMAALCRNKPQ